VTKRAELATWWVAGVFGVLGLVYAVILGWSVLHTVNWDLLFGNPDWNPANLTTAPPAPPVPQIPEMPGGGLPVPAPAPAPAPVPAPAPPR
jgi:hypothetical protein